MAIIHARTTNGVTYQTLTLRWKPGMFTAQEATLNALGSVSTATDYIMQALAQDGIVEEIDRKLRQYLSDGRLVIAGRTPGDVPQDNVLDILEGL